MVYSLFVEVASNELASKSYPIIILQAYSSLFYKIKALVWKEYFNLESRFFKQCILDWEYNAGLAMLMPFTAQRESAGGHALSVC